MFIKDSDIVQEPVPMGVNEFFSHPDQPHAVPAKDVILIRATIKPGQGHDFHYHQQREEFLYILEGEIEQWVNMEKRVCGSGDVIYVPPGVVHGSFNVGDKDAKLLAIFGSLQADVELATDVSDQQPWSLLR